MRFESKVAGPEVIEPPAEKTIDLAKLIQRSKACHYNSSNLDARTTIRTHTFLTEMKIPTPRTHYGPR